MDEVKGNLQDAQKKVDNSKADLTRIKNELVPLEVGVAGGGGFVVLQMLSCFAVSTARTH